jgi:superfamily I DNA/RNA helicase
VVDACEDLKVALDQFRLSADADLAAALQQELSGAIDDYERLKARAGALDFLDLLLKARDLVRGNAGVRRGFQRRFSHIFVDEFQDTDPLQAEILLLLASRNPDEDDWRKVVPVPAASSSSATRSSRFTASAGRTSGSTARSATA